MLPPGPVKSLFKLCFCVSRTSTSGGYFPLSSKFLLEASKASGKLWMVTSSSSSFASLRCPHQSLVRRQQFSGDPLGCPRALSAGWWLLNLSLLAGRWSSGMFGGYGQSPWMLGSWGWLLGSCGPRGLEERYVLLVQVMFQCWVVVLWHFVTQRAATGPGAAGTSGVLVAILCHNILHYETLTTCEVRSETSITSALHSETNIVCVLHSETRITCVLHYETSIACVSSTYLFTNANINQCKRCKPLLST